jgi:hypothetical protein
MILRRIIAHFRKQEWTAIGIDFVIVVLGVFIGIQVANWNQARADAQLGRFYLERIAEDVRGDARRLEVSIRSWEEEAEESEAIVRFLRDGDRARRSEWDMFELIYYRAGWAAFAADRTTYAELVSTGQVRLINDPDLRREIGGYYQSIDDYARFYQFDTPLRERVRGKYPPEAQRYFWESCFSDQAYRSNRDAWRDCAPFEDAGAIQRTLASLRGDRDLLEATQYALSMRYITIQSARTDLAHANELVARIEGAL